MDGECRFRVGEIAVLNCGKFKGREVEIVGELRMRLIMVIRDYRVERETYAVLMHNGSISPVLPQFLQKRCWWSANADALETETH